jgi:3-oxoacyl-[acyl-carrier protein] reductase
MISLSGKKALITGATGGIGGAILELLSSLGATCVASGSSEEKLSALQSKFPNVKTIRCDLSNHEDIKNLGDKTLELMGGIDILVANAGITKDGLSMRMKPEDWNNVINVNLTSSFLLYQKVISTMMKQRSGRIVFITSVIGVTGNAGQANYASSKAGLIGLAKSLAQEVASRGVTINCVAPGFIKTPMTEKIDESAIVSRIPMGRQGDPTDIANAVAFLCSGAASYITGETLHVNGGMYMS